jgi:hypothetical protein
LPAKSHKKHPLLAGNKFLRIKINRQRFLVCVAAQLADCLCFSILIGAVFGTEDSQIF